MWLLLVNMVKMVNMVNMVAGPPDRGSRSLRWLMMNSYVGCFHDFVGESV